MEHFVVVVVSFGLAGLLAAVAAQGAEQPTADLTDAQIRAIEEAAPPRRSSMWR
jgi:succinate dehydrogenase/fumarate reductase flavoprotein subunit